MLTAHLNVEEQCQAQACRQQTAHRIIQHSCELRNELTTRQKGVDSTTALLEQNLLHSISLGKLKAEDQLLKRIIGYRDTVTCLRPFTVAKQGKCLTFGNQVKLGLFLWQDEAKNVCTQRQQKSGCDLCSF